jgi:hypothetical protein
MDDFLNQQYPAGLLSTLGINPEDLRRQQQQAGLLSAGLQLLAGSGYSPVRQSTGQLLGQAGMAGVQGMQQAGESAIERALRGMQVQRFAEAQKRDQAGREALRQFSERMTGVTPQGALAAPGGAAGPTVERAATIGQTKPMTSQDIIAMASNPDISEETRKNILTLAQITAPKPPELPASYREYMLAKQDPVNPYQGSYVQYQQDLRRAGATNVSLSTEKSYGGALAGEVAKSDAAKFEAANVAPRVIDTVNSTRQLLDSGNVITGIGAQQRLDLARFGQLLGVTGKNTNEVVANTQQLFANRAQATLDSIRSSGLGAGQGFSNKDREFLENARLGNITYSPEALKRQLTIEENVAKATIDSWNTRLKNIPQDARQSLGLGEVAMPTVNQKPKIPRYNPATGRVE